MGDPARTRGMKAGAVARARLRSAALSPWGPLVAVGLYIACAQEPNDPGPDGDDRYDLMCPGADGCADADGPLLAGVAVRDITPEVKETFSDCGQDGICPDDPAWTAADTWEMDGEFQGHPSLPDGLEPFDDVDGDGIFDAVWIAGYGNARPAQGVHDPVEARALVLRRGDTTLALVTVDLIGYFYDEVERIRNELDPALGVDLLMVSASHTHEGPDAIGIWGYDEGTTGVDAAYMEHVRDQILAAVEEAVGGLTEATLIAAAGPSGGHPQPDIEATYGFNNIVEDYRDPVVVDEEMRVMQLRSTSDDSVIATVMNWTNHPESLCSENSYISSDFVHYMREVVEDGVDRGGVSVEGEGGVALFINGAVGGMQSPGRIEIFDLDGTQLTETCRHTGSPDDAFFARPRAFGQLAGLDALRVLREAGEVIDDPSLGFASKRFSVTIENRGYHAMFITGVFYGACVYDRFGTEVPRRCIHDFDEDEQLTEGNLPALDTEVARIVLGDIEMITVPGELLPEWFVGGYDGSHVGPQQELIDGWHNQEHGAPHTCDDDVSCGPFGDPECAGVEILPGRTCASDNCCCVAGTCRSIDYNPPELDAAPAGPYLRDRMVGRYRWVLGLTPDELGYIIPPYDYELDARQPYIEEARGHHYEETNSVGPTIGPLVEEHLIGLFEAMP